MIPLMGIGGMQLFKAETSGPVKSRLLPTIQDTVKAQCGIYVFFTVIGIVLLWLGGINLFDSICHIFSALSTAGFSTKNTSVAGLGSTYAEWVILLIMIIGATNFALHFELFKGNLKSYIHDEEFKFYSALLIGMTLIVAWNLFRLDIYSNFFTSLHHAAFTMGSILTTTGFSSANFETWDSASLVMIVLGMLIGGSAGSTAGALKALRVLLLGKLAYREIYRLIHPHAVVPIKINNKIISSEVIQSVYGFSFLYLMIFILFSLLMLFMGLDVATAFSAVATALGNVGMGLGTVGPWDNCDHLPLMAKALLSAAMIIGRLELYTILICFVPAFWKK
jgi:trk system potassium uptake protein TrkH